MAGTLHGKAIGTIRIVAVRRRLHIGRQGGHGVTVDNVDRASFWRFGPNAEE
jgi:hypothetical protein